MIDPLSLPADSDIYRYRRGAVARYVAAYAIAAVISLAILGYSVFSLINYFSWVTLIGGVVLFGGATVTCIVGAVTASHRWGDDDRIAIAANSEGLVLPRIGLIPWTRVDSLGVWMISDTPAAAALLGITARIFGSAGSRRIVVYVSDIDPYLARSKKAFAFAERRPGTLVTAPSSGFATAFAPGLEQPFADVASAVALAAGTRGVRVDYHLDWLYFRPASHRGGPSRYGCKGCETRWLGGDNGTLVHLGYSKPYAVDVWHCTQCDTFWEDGAVFPRMLSADEVHARVPPASA